VAESGEQLFGRAVGRSLGQVVLGHGPLPGENGRAAESYTGCGACRTAQSAERRGANA
jgi:hypothetical protein